MLLVPRIIPTQLLSTVQWSPATATQTTSNADLAIGSCSYYSAVHCSAKLQLFVYGVIVAERRIDGLF